MRLGAVAAVAPALCTCATTAGGPLFQELDDSDPLAFSAEGWELGAEGRVVMRFVHSWGETDCRRVPDLSGERQLGACWNNVGILQDNYNDSLPLYAAAIAAAPADSAPHFNLAVALQRMARGEEAAASFGRAAELNPTEAVIPRAHGAMHEERGEPELAEAVYRAAAERGVWRHWRQRAPHLVRSPPLLARPWHWPLPEGSPADGVAEAVGAWVRALEVRMILSLLV